MGHHLVKSWSSTQSEVALSSGEAEYYGAVKASGIGLGFQSLLQDLGVTLPLRVWTDSTATIGICSRDGLGKLRHIDTKCLWLQQKVRSGKLEVRKVKGTENPADVFTKHLSNSQTVEGLLKLFNCEYRDGRPDGAPRLRPGSGTELGTALGVVDRCYSRGVEEDAKTVLQEEDEFKVDKGFMERNGYTFRAVDCEGTLVPEAWSYKQVVLPHLTGSEMDALFPVAVAARHAGDEDYAPEPCGLEVRGQEMIGHCDTVARQVSFGNSVRFERYACFLNNSF